jgi:hypothetical protein
MLRTKIVPSKSFLFFFISFFFSSFTSSSFTSSSSSFSSSSSYLSSTSISISFSFSFSNPPGTWLTYKVSFSFTSFYPDYLLLCYILRYTSYDTEKSTNIFLPLKLELLRALIALAAVFLASNSTKPNPLF